MDTNIWYFFCIDSCKINKCNKKELICGVNTDIDKIEDNSRISCLTYNNKITLHYDYNYKDIEHLDEESITFKNETMSIYDLLGDLFLKILENKIFYKQVVCNIYALKLNMIEQVYTRQVIENLFNTINSKTLLKINIHLINQEIINIKDIFNLNYVELTDCKLKIKPRSYSRSRSSDSIDKSGKKNIYFNIHIRN